MVPPASNRFARGLNDIVAREGDWSQDGTKLVFTKGQDISLANAGGTGARKLLSVSGVPSDVPILSGWPAAAVHGERHHPKYIVALGGTSGWLGCTSVAARVE